MDTHELADEKLIVGYGPLAEFLTDNGYPLSKSTMSKYCSPAIDSGPPVEAYWGRLPAFSPSHALAWAKSRLKPVSASRSRPAVTSDAGSAAVTDDRSPSGDSPASKFLPPTEMVKAKNEQWPRKSRAKSQEKPGATFPKGAE
jgi:hypothetical protein